MIKDPRKPVPIPIANSKPDFTSLRRDLDIAPTWFDPALEICVARLPSIPPINDHVLAEQAVTHTSYYASNTDNGLPLSQLEKQVRSYENLEVIGDRYLGFSAALSLRNRYPRLSPHATSVSTRRMAAAARNADDKV